MLINHPGPWQQFQLRHDNRGLSVMEIKSKYLHEQYLFEAQMNTLNQMHQQNFFMNGGGGGPASTPEPTYSTSLQLKFYYTLEDMNTYYSFDVTSATGWNESGKFTFNDAPSNFETVEIVDNYTINLKGNEEGISVIDDAFSRDAYLTHIEDINANCISEVKSGAFFQTGLLERAVLDNVTTIGLSAFNECSNLTSVHFGILTTIPNGIDDTQGVFAYSDLSGLDNFDDGFPSLQIAGAFSFYQTVLNSVRSLTLDSIGIQAFSRSNISTIDISGVSNITIRARAFQTCTSLTNISISPEIDFATASDQFDGISETGNGVFNTVNRYDQSVTYLETSPYTWTITTP